MEKTSILIVEDDVELGSLLGARLALKGAKPAANTSVRILPEKPEAFQIDAQSSLLAGIDKSRFPLMELGMTLDGGTWFAIYQSMKFDFGEFIQLQQILLAVYAIAFCCLFYLALRLVFRPLWKSSC